MTRRALLRGATAAIAASSVPGIALTAPVSARAATAARASTGTDAVGEARVWAARAAATDVALQRYFAANDGTGLYRESYPATGAFRYSFLWPFSRVLSGSLALGGIPARVQGARAGRAYAGAAEQRIVALTHYWAAAATPPGYDSYVVPPSGSGAERYYDDNAWIGLALTAHHRMTGAAASLAAARRVLAFVYPGGWDERRDAVDPGGIFWVQQGIGLGRTNHDRTTTSNAPNGELASHLAQLVPRHASHYTVPAVRTQQWVSANLIGAADLVCDKVTGIGAVDPTLYTYNQGALIAADVMRYRLTGQPSYLAQAETVAAAALRHFTLPRLITHTPAFNAIYFRGLLQLLTVTASARLQAIILGGLRRYAEAAWAGYRSPAGLFNFPNTPAGAYLLLDQGAMVQIFAMLAWDPVDYPKLAA